MPPSAFKRSKGISLSVLAMIVAGCSNAAAASDVSAEDGSGWSGLVGAGAIHQPTYPGSPNLRTTPVPLFSVAYVDPRLGTFSLDERGLSWTFLDAHNFRAGLLAGVDTGRRSRREPGDWLNAGDNRLRGMGDLKSTVEAGALLGYGPVNLIARKAVDDNGHQGFIADLEIGHSVELSDQLELSVGIGARWADQKYQQAYFGVTQAQAAASRFNAFTPKEGFVHGSVHVGLDYRFSSAWHALLGVTFQQLIEETRTSPLAEKPYSVSAFAGIARRFD